MLIFDKKKLRQRSKEWTGTLEELEVLVDKMGETMEENKGVGIAAIQVGEPYRVFLVGEGDRCELFINPRQISLSPYKKKHWEACLSCKNTTVRTSRSHSITLTYDTIKEGLPVVVKRTFKGFEAVKVQHELDHINGFLIMDRGKAYYGKGSN
tara:strand:+ start:185 stop:643 length:459 start_codon:yes stop_codon:yes gene_type:complete